jgi:trehalose synthase
VDSLAEEAAYTLVSSPSVETSLGLHGLEDYEPLIGSEAVERIARKAELLWGLHVVHLSSTFYGGGVAEMLTPFNPAHEYRIDTGWRMLQGTSEVLCLQKEGYNSLKRSQIEPQLRRESNIRAG